MSTTNRGNHAPLGLHMKKRIVALTVSIILALIAAGVFTAIDGYTKSARTKVELQNTYRQLQVKQSELEKNKLDSVENQKKIEELTKQLQAKKEAATALAESAVQAPRIAYTPPAGSHTDWMAQAGISPSDYGYVDYIISHESGWRPDARNSLGCLGLAQACPGQKILNVCPDLNPVCQLRWASSYAGRYHGWAGAYQAWVSQHWW